MSDNILKVKNIYKKYGERKAVNDVSFLIKSGEIVGLLGANGAGKTSCFYIVCGLIKADSGQVFLNDIQINNMPMHKRAGYGLGYLPQDASIFRNLTVEDNVMAVLEMNNHLNAEQKQARLEKLLIEFNINYVRYVKGFSLSGGERRRVEIARALAMDIKFILLDEPFAGVDPISVSSIQKIIYGLKKSGIGVFITDHNYHEMLDTCDRSYVLHDGCLIASGDKKTILANKHVVKVYLGEK